MSLTIRINNLINEAYNKGQITITTTLQGFEVFEQEEIDELITDLRARGFRVSHDDVFNDMTIGLPDFTFAERARMIALDVDSVTKKYIESISTDILRASRMGYLETEREFFGISNKQILENIRAHFSREGIQVTRMDKPDNYSKLVFNWSA